MSEASTSYRDLPPVPPVEKPAAFRQTFMRYADHCPRAAYLSLRHGDGPSSHVLDRGTALHLVAERMMRDLIEQGEDRYASAGETQISEMTGALVDEVLDENPGLAVRQVDADAVRAMAYHLAIGNDVPPHAVLGLEREFRTVVEGETLTATIDCLYEIDSETLGIRDWKSSLGVPAQEEFKEHFYAYQLRFYAWIASREMGSYSRFVLSCGFPRYLGDDGLVRTRVLELDRHRVQEFGNDLARQVRKVKAAFEDTSGVVFSEQGIPHAFEDGAHSEVAAKMKPGQFWQAVPGDHCVYCPASTECPIPANLRRYAGMIQEPEHAAEALDWADRMGDRVTATKKEARAWLEENGPLGVDGFVWDLWVSDSKSLPKKKGSTDWEAVFAAAREGRDPTKLTTSTRLKRFKRSEWEKLHATGWEGE